MALFRPIKQQTSSGQNRVISNVLLWGHCIRPVADITQTMMRDTSWRESAPPQPPDSSFILINGWISLLLLLVFLITLWGSWVGWFTAFYTWWMIIESELGAFSFSFVSSGLHTHPHTCATIRNNQWTNASESGQTADFLCLQEHITAWSMNKI